MLEPTIRSLRYLKLHEAAVRLILTLTPNGTHS